MKCACSKSNWKWNRENALTGLTHNYVIRNSLSVFVLGCALVDPLEAFSSSLGNVHLQGARVGSHVHIGVLFDLKVGPVSRPRETEGGGKQSDSLFIDQ